MDAVVVSLHSVLTSAIIRPSPFCGALGLVRWLALPCEKIADETVAETRDGICPLQLLGSRWRQSLSPSRGDETDRMPCLLANSPFRPLGMWLWPSSLQLSSLSQGDKVAPESPAKIRWTVQIRKTSNDSESWAKTMHDFLKPLWLGDVCYLQKDSNTTSHAPLLI